MKVHIELCIIMKESLVTWNAALPEMVSAISSALLSHWVSQQYQHPKHRQSSWCRSAALQDLCRKVSSLTPRRWPWIKTCGRVISPDPNLVLRSMQWFTLINTSLSYTLYNHKVGSSLHYPLCNAPHLTDKFLKIFLTFEHLALVLLTIPSVVMYITHWPYSLPVICWQLKIWNLNDNF